ncbi:MAG: hypothetical protein IJ802_06870, partial [Kiritimatiellae bacterium]|nr:hypothetical protein [Kiritimatiellia bacterium]
MALQKNNANKRRARSAVAGVLALPFGVFLWLLLWTAMGLFALVPAKKAYGLGCAMASTIYPFFPKRRRLAIDNILKAQITSDRAAAARIAKDSWCHLLGHIFEALKVPKVITKENWREHLATDEGHPDAVKLLLDTPGEPILLVSAHHGVWEIATNILSFTRPMIAIARTLNNPFVAKWMKKH